MVKIPSQHEGGADPAAIERRTQFLHDTGVLIHMWNMVEIYIELAIWRITKLSPLHCSIMLGGLQHKAKISILYALLREDGNDAAISKLKSAMSYAKRNALVHSIIGSEEDSSKFVFYYRSVDDRYKVVAHTFDQDSFHDHVWQFCKLANDALIEIGCDELAAETIADLKEYGQKARFEGLER